MTFPQAFEISRQMHLHVRREDWAEDKWIIAWGTGECWAGGERRPILATDLGAVDLLAEDWTTVPAPLAACPVTPSEPTGGSTPTPGSGGFPDDLAEFSRPSTSGGGGGSSSSLPTPEEGTSLRVQFSGLTYGNDPNNEYRGIDHMDGFYTLPSVGEGSWQKKFPRGSFYPAGTETSDHPFEWTITANRNPDGSGGFTYEVTMTVIAVPSGAAPTGGFGSLALAPRLSPINNVWTAAGPDVIQGGTATVL